MGLYNGQAAAGKPEEEEAPQVGFHVFNARAAFFYGALMVEEGESAVALIAGAFVFFGSGFGWAEEGGEELDVMLLVVFFQCAIVEGEDLAELVEREVFQAVSWWMPGFFFCCWSCVRSIAV